MKEVLRFDNVSMHYHSKQGETVALQAVNFSVNEGEFVAIIGPSGCGKTTLLRILIGLIEPDSGTILKKGKDTDQDLNTEQKLPFYSCFIFSLPLDFC